jgi:hypothetical protein
MVEKLFFGGGTCGAYHPGISPLFLGAGKMFKQIQRMTMSIGKQNNPPVEKNNPVSE